MWVQVPIVIDIAEEIELKVLFMKQLQKIVDSENTVCIEFDSLWPYGYGKVHFPGLLKH